MPYSLSLWELTAVFIPSFLSLILIRIEDRNIVALNTQEICKLQGKHSVGLAVCVAYQIRQCSFLPAPITTFLLQRVQLY